MLYILGSLVIAVLGTTGTWIALRGHARAAAWWLLWTQPIGTAYDLWTRQYGFLLFIVVNLTMVYTTLRSRAGKGGSDPGLGVAATGGSPSFFFKKRDQR